jgi:hypothetical protein
LVARIHDLFTVVGGLLPRIRDPVALIRDPVAVIGDPIALICDPIALIGGLLARVGGPLTLGVDPRVHPRLALPTMSPTLATQQVTFALQGLVVGTELRRPALNLRAKVVDPFNFTAPLDRSGAQPAQLGALHFKHRRPTL